MTAATPNHYDVLGVARDATPEEIKAAFRRKSSEHHPDKGGDADAMAAVNRAWEVLGDAARRAQYDADGTDQQLDLDAMASGVLASMFSGALQQASQDHTLDPVRFTKYQLHNRVTEAKNEIKAAERAIVQLTKQRGSVRRKTEGQPNLVHSIIDARLKAVRASIPQNEKVVSVTERALELLRDYEYVPPETKFDSSVEDRIYEGLLRLQERGYEGFDGSIGSAYGAGRFRP